MNTRTIKQYKGPLCSQAEAERLVAELKQRADCIDARETTCSVEAYFAIDPTTRTKPKLPRGCRVVPTPRYVPGDHATLHWHFLGAGSGSRVRIVHLSYLGKSGYRYFIVVLAEYTEASGWIDEDGLDPVEATLVPDE